MNDSTPERWFCWICRKPMSVVHGQRPDSTQYKINGTWRDCHESCYDDYSEGLPGLWRKRAKEALYETQ